MANKDTRRKEKKKPKKGPLRLRGDRPSRAGNRQAQGRQGAPRVGRRSLAGTAARRRPGGYAAAAATSTKP